MEERALRGRQLRRAPARALFAQPLLRARLVRPLSLSIHQEGGSLGKGKPASCALVRQRGATSFPCATNSWVFAKIFHRRAALSSDALTMR